MIAVHDIEAWITQAEQGGAQLSEALDVFDALPSPSLADMIGRWKGSSIATGHVLDGMLEAYHWYGKEFRGQDEVLPLLFGRRSPVAIDPRFLPLNRVTAWLQRFWLVRNLFLLGFRIIATNKPSARLRTVSCRGVPTLSMIYDRQPIIDAFRLVKPGLVLGMMDCRGFEPLFFVLRREAQQDHR